MSIKSNYLRYFPIVESFSKLSHHARKLTGLITLLFVLIIPIPSINGETYYVSSTGNDLNNGNVNSPWHTIAAAWVNSGGGDTVLVREGTYTESQIWFHPNSQGPGIKNQFWTLMAHPGEKVQFVNCRFIIDAGYVRIQGLEFSGTSFLQAVSWAGIHEYIEILDNEFSGVPGVAIYFNANNGLVQGNNIHPQWAVHGIYVMHGDNNVIRCNNIRGVEKYGIHIYDENKYGYAARITNLLVENNIVSASQSRSGQSIDFSIEIDSVVVRNNVVINNFEDGITIRYYGHVRNVDIFNNVLYGNRADGLRISAEDVDRISVINNIFSSNGLHMDVTSNLNDLTISHNLYWHAESQGTGTADDHAVYGNPVFLNENNADFHLMAGSPAIDVGLDVGLPYNGSAPDLGAFESGFLNLNESTGNRPDQFNLQQNYPNPFNNSTKIYYSLSNKSDVELSLFDISGHHIRTLVKANQIAGLKSVTWDGKDEKNNFVSSGIYFYMLQTGNFSSTKKMLIIR